MITEHPAKLIILDPSTRATFSLFQQEWAYCVRCSIGEIAHHKVHTRGTLPCEVLLIGEAPGKTEDLTGWPFVGQSGRLLSVMIERCSKPFTWAITNLVLCRPTDHCGGKNRAPSDREKLNCQLRLSTFIATIARPKKIVLLGGHAAGSMFEGHSAIPTIRLKHPAWFLYSKLGVESERFAQEVLRLDGFVNG